MAPAGCHSRWTPATMSSRSTSQRTASAESHTSACRTSASSRGGCCGTCLRSWPARRQPSSTARTTRSGHEQLPHMRTSISPCHFAYFRPSRQRTPPTGPPAQCRGHHACRKARPGSYGRDHVSANAPAHTYSGPHCLPDHLNATVRTLPLNLRQLAGENHAADWADPRADFIPAKFDNH
jgi:hypothetical protein